jgi:hypothetical protein
VKALTGVGIYCLWQEDHLSHVPATTKWQAERMLAPATERRKALRRYKGKHISQYHIPFVPLPPLKAENTASFHQYS